VTSLTQHHHALHKKSSKKTTEKGHTVTSEEGEVEQTSSAIQVALKAQQLQQLRLEKEKLTEQLRLEKEAHAACKLLKNGAPMVRGDALEDAQVAAALASTGVLAAAGQAPAAAASQRPAASVDADGLISPTRVLTRVSLKLARSSLPIWEMANKHVRDSDELFERPAEKLNQLHRPMLCNMSYWGGNDLHTCIMARILMTLSILQPKQEAIFGNNQIPPEYGGGPWYSASESCFEPTKIVPNSKLR